MTSRVYINDLDIYATYGLYIAEGSYAKMIQWPALKDVPVTDWHEYDGVEPDLDNVALDSREFTLHFAGTTSESKVEAFMSALRSRVYHNLSTNIGRNYTVRLVSAEPAQWADDLCKISIRFADDFPLRGYEYEAPSSSILTEQLFIIDDIPLAQYGIVVLDGTRAQLEQMPDIKPNLTRSTMWENGVMYDGDGQVTRNSYSPRIRCLMRASTLGELWRNYDALLYQLSQSGKHYLIDRYKTMQYAFYYESCNVRGFYPEGKIWLEFDIVVNVYTKPTRILL